MKKLFISLLLLLQLCNGFSQVVFCPPGATWNYNFAWYLPYTLENTSIKYIGDTISGTDTLKIINGYKFYKHQNCKGIYRTLIKQKGDTIFMNNSKTQNSWQILYNYAALPGQNWKTTFLSAKNNVVTYTISIDSIGLTAVNNVSLKTLYVTYIAIGRSEKARIIERFGCDAYMFNYYTDMCASDADYFRDFLCYSDNAFGTKQFTDKACNYSDAVSLTEIFSKVRLTIYPNPTSGTLILESENVPSLSGYTIRLVNILGETVSDDKTFSGKAQLNIAYLKSGLYFLQVFEKEKLIEQRKIIKN